MAIIETDNWIFDVEVEKTKIYYEKHSRIQNIEMKNFEKYLPDESPELAHFLSDFGVDIRYPDEFCWCWQSEDEMLHYNVAYTITGKVLKAEHTEMILRDKSRRHIVLETEYVPNEQTEPYFAFTVYNIELPWGLEEPYPGQKEGKVPISESWVKKLLKKLKKC